jgi:glycogen debranching enzyme
VTLVEGSSFCICEAGGDIRPGGSQGLFFQDTRLLDTFELGLEGEVLEPLTLLPGEPWSTTFLCRVRPRRGQSQSTLLVRRDRFVGKGMREDLTVTNLSNSAARVRVLMNFDADFADLFQVKEGHVPGRPLVHRAGGTGEVQLVRAYPGGHRRGVAVRWAGAVAQGTGLGIDLTLAPRGRAVGVIEVLPLIEGELIPPMYPTDRPLEQTAPVQLSRAWQRSTATIDTDDATLSRTLRRSKSDLGGLRITDPERPGAAVLAAGAPWFMALFGRDSLLSSYMALALDPDLALATVRTLARLQGARFDAASEEEPGRILHEVRFGAEPSLALGGRNVYYGTADATPLFVVLLGELQRWGLPDAALQNLVPHADRALDWITRHGDGDGDLFVQYRRTTDRGLVNQGWKDSWDGVTFADGRIATPPVALCEVQGYAYAAFRARAEIAAALNDEPTRRTCTERAERLRAAFNERFWLAENGWYALALDGDSRPVDSLASNMGHCLWSGIVEDDKAPAVVEHLLSESMFSGWGVRTLATSMAAYNPMSYHNGSIWPHDNALIVEGLMRYGFVSEAQRVALAVLEAATAFDGRLPELFCGFDRAEFPSPVPFPTSCSPQAWASAAPIHLLRSLLRLDPDVPAGTVRLAPALPAGFPALHIANLRLGDAVVDLHAEGRAAELAGLPDGLRRVPNAGPHDDLR